ncbi:lysozyme c-1-like [Cimex lectularius]|uniref:lysozyme n=1 Tax=Cimex lectularius TaxID=79782 RepID=A0A8I6TI51_CIMLE|nr:lysozyme c-1-like [Cimex lectularius]
MYELRNFLKVIFAIVAVFVVGTELKKFTKCELAKELTEKGANTSDLPKWICIAEQASNLNSKNSTRFNTMYFVGLYKISNAHCSTTNETSGTCNVTCQTLRQDDITEQVKCALKLKEEYGFQYWSTIWNRTCQYNNYTLDCPTS